jgi:hypothetical protein
LVFAVNPVFFFEFVFNIAVFYSDSPIEKSESARRGYDLSYLILQERSPPLI